MLELLAPAGSPEAVVAAVQNGADAVYMGFDDFNARKNAKNFTDEDMARAAEYCRVRGTKVYITLNVLATDRELTLVERLAKKANRLGADALIVQDLGVLRAARQGVPDMPIHASTQMSVHNIDGVRRAAELGASRVVVARELSKAHIAYICKHAPIEIEVFVHGALCMSYSGQCYMSAVIGERSGNRGLCAQPCRLGYSLDGAAGSHLSLKDYCLAGHLQELETCGVRSLKIEGRMKRPEYTAIVTKVYADALREGREPTEEELRLMAAAFSREGFTDAYFEGKKGPDMLGVRTDDNKRELKVFAQVRNAYTTGELQRVPVRFVGMIRRGETAKLAVQDDSGNVLKTEGPFPEPAISRELTRVTFQTQLYKTGGTPYRCTEVKSVIDPGVNFSLSEINAMRRTLLDELSVTRARHTPRPEGIFRPAAREPGRKDPPQLNISLTKVGQLTPELADLGPKLIYLPLDEIAAQAHHRLRPYLEREDLTFAAVLPRVIWDDERDAVRGNLDRVLQSGVSQCLAGNIGHIEMAKKAGFSVRGDFGLNLFNSEALQVLRDLELQSATPSFELNMAQIRDLSRALDLELIVYGRLPLMLTENCIVQNVKGRCVCDGGMQLSDRKGAAFPVLKESGCRNVIYNSRKLFLADKSEDYMNMGLWGVRLSFTTENAKECLQVTERYLNLGHYEPGGYTRGLYYRGVE